MCGLSSEAEEQEFVNVTDEQQRRMLSIAQDIIYLASNGRKSMPKHTSLAMAVRHLTGSAQLIGILNGLGHTTSHTTVFEHDTALAKKEIQQGNTALPNCLQQSIFTTLGTIMISVKKHYQEEEPHITQMELPSSMSHLEK